MSTPEAPWADWAQYEISQRLASAGMPQELPPDAEPIGLRMSFERLEDDTMKRLGHVPTDTFVGVGISEVASDPVAAVVQPRVSEAENIYWALSLLDPEDRDIIARRYGLEYTSDDGDQPQWYEQQSLQEVAEAYGLKVTAARGREVKALARLRRIATEMAWHPDNPEAVHAATDEAHWPSGRPLPEVNTEKYAEWRRKLELARPAVVTTHEVRLADVHKVGEMQSKIVLELFKKLNGTEMFTTGYSPDSWSLTENIKNGLNKRVDPETGTLRERPEMYNNWPVRRMALVQFVRNMPEFKEELEAAHQTYTQAVNQRYLERIRAGAEQPQTWPGILEAMIGERLRTYVDQFLVAEAPAK
jgi:hypothetical protein